MLAAVTVVLYLPGLTAPFIYDDLAHLIGRGEIQRLWPIGPLLDDGRPAGFLSFALNHAVTGMRPAGFRAVNIVIHLATGLLLMGLVSRVLRLPGIPAHVARYADPLAFAAALVFVVHPLNTGAVTYVIQRFESLSACFFVLALYALLRSAEHSRPRWYAAAIAAAWLAMLTKQTSAVLPITALLFDRAFLANGWRDVFARRWWVHLGFCAGIGVLMLSDALRKSGVDAGSAGFGFGITPWEYLRSQPRSLARYLQLTLWPERLIFDYGWKVVDDPKLIYGLGALIVVLLVAAIVAWFVRPQLGFLGLATFAALAPSSSFLPIADLAVEYRMYLPLLSLLTLLVLLAWEGICRATSDEDFRRKFGFALLALTVAPLAVRTLLRNRDYQSPLLIWKQSADFNPDNGRANYNTAGRLGPGRLQEGEPYFEAAIASDFWDQAAVHTTWADYLVKNDQPEDAAIHYRQAIKLLPQDVPVRIKLAELYLAQGEREKARAEAAAALKYDRRNKPAAAILERLAGDPPP